MVVHEHTVLQSNDFIHSKHRVNIGCIPHDINQAQTSSSIFDNLKLDLPRQELFNN